MHVFITRDLSPDSEFSRLLRAQGRQVHGQSLVTLKPLSFHAVPDCDWIFFASKNAVHFFFEQVKRQSIALPGAKWAALGDATADALTPYVATIDFRGNGDPEATAAAFQLQAVHHIPGDTAVRVLLPAARHSMNSIAAYLSDTFEIVQLEVYDNQPIANPPERRDEVLVFTSPMNAQTYFNSFALLPFQKVVAIGATTAGALRQLGIADVVTAAAANERNLAEAILGMRNGE